MSPAAAMRTARGSGERREHRVGARDAADRRGDDDVGVVRRAGREGSQERGHGTSRGSSGERGREPTSGRRPSSCRTRPTMPQPALPGATVALTDATCAADARDSDRIHRGRRRARCDAGRQRMQRVQIAAEAARGRPRRACFDRRAMRPVVQRVDELEGGTRCVHLRDRALPCVRRSAAAPGPASRSARSLAGSGTCRSRVRCECRACPETRRRQRCGSGVAREGRLREPERARRCSPATRTLAGAEGMVCGCDEHRGSRADAQVSGSRGARRLEQRDLERLAAVWPIQQGHATHMRVRRRRSPRARQPASDPRASRATTGRSRRRRGPTRAQQMPRDGPRIIARDARDRTAGRSARADRSREVHDCPERRVGPRCQMRASAAERHRPPRAAPPDRARPSQRCASDRACGANSRQFRTSMLLVLSTGSVRALSRPAPPTTRSADRSAASMRSSPGPPEIASRPPSPLIVSLPAPPSRTSPDSPPRIRSSPPSPRMRSTPAPPSKRSRPAPPRRWSPPSCPSMRSAPGTAGHRVVSRAAHHAIVRRRHRAGRHCRIPPRARRHPGLRATTIVAADPRERCRSRRRRRGDPPPSRRRSCRARLRPR